MVARWALATALVALGTSCAEETVPEELIHVWRTELPAYRDRYFEVRADSLVFGTGGQTSTSHPIVGVELGRTRKDELRCTLAYETADGARTQVRLVYRPGPPEMLRFENRDEVWLREQDATWLARRTR